MPVSFADKLVIAISSLSALHRIQSEFPPKQWPIRTALVTARSAPAHERVIRTLRAWDIRINEPENPGHKLGRSARRGRIRVRPVLAFKGRMPI